ncbi:hypothetical protein GCM10022289_32710 [Pedobacter jeongneungensis]|uniref:Uncharacterized protein n=1 Tax=Pedobacter jeongneungensis TaxID=947309 RepID=A0ABP8BK63_9SPHI
MGFALGIGRVQYRFFIGTEAQRSPEKPDPFPIIHRDWGTPKLVYSSQLAVFNSTCFALSAFTFLLGPKYDMALKLMQSETFIFGKSLI